MADCGCTGSSSTPPGTTPGSVNAPAGSKSSYGGTVTVPRGTCGPAPCPTPPTSEVDEREPYCPSWVELMKGSAVGRLILAVEGCLFQLASKCSGYLFYNAETGHAEVVNPPYVSSIPKQTKYGMLAKVVPTVTNICQEDSDTCIQEIRSEVAAQIMGELQCGELVIATPPLCGELPATESADQNDQVRFDYLTPLDQEKAGCPSEIRFLGYSLAKRGTGRMAVDCKNWISFRRLKMRGSQWGMLPSGSPDELSGYMLLAVPVPGGEEGDPCFEMRMSSQKIGGGLPTSAENCDTVVFKDKGLPTAGWKTEPKGLSFHPVERRDLQTSSGIGAGSTVINLTDYPTNACGDVWCQVEVILKALVGPSGSTTSIHLGVGAYTIGYCGYGQDIFSQQAMFPVPADSFTLHRTKSGTGITQMWVRIIGYWY